ncbi:MAG: DinB family protein [Promethearchaeota archaeon]
MKQQLIEDIKSGLLGRLTHLEPEKVLEGLSPTVARKKPSEETYSCWDLLYHTVFWQDILLKNINGEVIDWSKIEAKNNWPSAVHLTKDANFKDLTEKFYENIKNAGNILEKVDLGKGVKIGPEHTPEVSNFRLFLVFLQHTSYHLGQIVTVRKFLEDWKQKT